MSARRRRGRSVSGPRSGRGPDGSFADSLDGIRPLPERDKSIPPGSAASRSKRARGTPFSPPAPPPAAEPARFEHPDPELPALGVASGINRSQLRRLRAGEIPIEREIDLHSLRAVDARRALIAGLRDAIAAGERCILVIHGKGRGREQSPVLRPALPDWLTDPALAGQVLAFSPAASKHGGTGATYVLLRRPVE